MDTALLTGIATATGGQYLSVSTAEDLPDVFRTISEEIEPTDTDDDGIPDITETTGFRDGFGNWYTTDPENPDTDGDGLLDGEEAGVVTTVEGRVFFHFTSNPLKIDSDNDGIDDPDEEEFSCNPLDWDTDNDRLNDGFELEIGTDPLVKDTDFDGYSDYDEHYDPAYDPLVYEKRYSNLEIAREFVLGAVLGEFGYEEHDSFYYLAGHIVSGFVALGDIRDMAASIINGDVVGTLLNGLSIVPLYGDAAKIATNVGEFVVKHADEAGNVAIHLAKFIPAGTVRTQAIKAAAGESANGLIAKGFDENAIAKLSEHGIDIVKFNEALDATNAFDNYLGLSAFVEKHIVDDTGQILNDRCRFTAKKLVAAQKAGKPQSYVNGYVNNLKGAYTEYLAQLDTGGDVIKDVSHVNKGGMDYVALKDGTLTMVESKAVQSLSISKLKNYITPNKITGELEFNLNYALKELGDEYLKDPSTPKEFVLYINSPVSETVKQALNLPEIVPYKYKDRFGQEITDTVKITVKSVSK